MNGNDPRPELRDEQRTAAPTPPQPPLDPPPDPPPQPWQVLVGTIIAIIWVFCVLAWLTYFAFFYENAFDRPLGFLQEMIICAAAASMFSALLTQVLHSRGVIRGTLWQVGFTFTGAAAVFFAIIALYFYARPKESPPGAVVYTVVNSVNPNLRISLVVEPQPGQLGQTVEVYKERLGNGERWKMIVVFPPKVLSANVRLTTGDAIKTFKLYGTDATTRNVILKMPSGEKSKEE